jgi:hypothetical protein
MTADTLSGQLEKLSTRTLGHFGGVYKTPSVPSVLSGTVVHSTEKTPAAIHVSDPSKAEKQLWKTF